MFELDKKLRLDKATIESPNLTSRFEDGDLRKLGSWVIEGYKADKSSRAQWEKRMESAINLAVQLQEDKTFPWAGCSNVKFPLVTIAAMQWASRAYPLLIQGPNVVKCRVIGGDPDGKKRLRADRVSTFMSYQVLEEDEAWEEETDRLLIQVPILGCGFKKTYYAASKGRNVSEFVSAKDLVVNYWAKSLDDAERKTHVIPLSRNTIYERVMGKTFRDVTSESWFQNAPSPVPLAPEKAKENLRRGIQPPQPDETTPYTCLEQHVRVDLDGDGYAEPYIITVELGSGDVLRLVCNFSAIDVLRTSSGDVASIREDKYFTKFSFIPSPDGGVYELGFGILLGPLNESVNSLINQLIDAGTLATTAGGFLGRGVKIRGGEYSFRPFGWQRVDSTGEDLAKGVFPFPVRDPSAVLLQLLTLLIDYTNRMSGSTDIMVGENPGQNTPAQTSQLMAEQGAKINTAIFKRMWRGFKEEFQKLYALNKKNVPISAVTYGEKSGFISREDFTGPEQSIRPAADPNLSSDSARVNQAMAIKQMSGGGGYDRDAVERNLLRAMRVENMDELYKGLQAIPPPPNPKVSVQEAKDQGALQREALKHKSRLQEKLALLMSQKDMNDANIELIEAQVAQIVTEIGAAKSAQDEAEFRRQLDEAKHELDRAKTMDESFRGYIELIQQGNQSEQGNNQGGAGGVAKPPGNAAGQGGSPS